MQNLWESAPVDYTLPSGEVHVWRMELDQPAERVEALGRSLSAEELARANRFQFDRDRQHFVVARGLLRFLLGRYTAREPEHVAITYGNYGKPELLASVGRSLSFNVSHAGDQALMAFTPDQQIGVDIEAKRPLPDLETIAAQFFSPHEQAALRSLPLEDRVDAFYNIWTRKEAFIKATGYGLMFPLDQFDVSLGPNDPACLLTIRASHQLAAHWTLTSLVAASGYAAALAVDGKVQRVRCFSASATL